MATEARRRAVAKYDKTHAKMYAFKFNRETDADIIAKLDSLENKQAYIKDLIRADIDTLIDTTFEKPLK